MGILFALISSILGSFWNIFYKKATIENKASPYGHLASGYISLFFVGILLIVLGFTGGPLETFVSWKQVVGFLVYVGLYLTINPIEQIAYKIEKLSTLQPFGHIGSIIGILLGFFILGDGNIFVLSSALLAFGILTTYTIMTTRGIRLSRGVATFIGARVIRGIYIFVTGVILTENALLPEPLNALSVFTYDGLFTFMVLLIGLTVSKKIHLIKHNTGTYYSYRLGGAVMGDTSFFIGLFLVSELGILVSTLLSLIGMISTLILSYLFFKDKPKKGDIVISTIVLMLIAVGYSLGQ